MKRLRMAAMVGLALLLLALFAVSVGAQGGVAGYANMRITNFYRAAPRPTLLVGMNGTINATGTYQPISGTTGSSVSVSGDNLTVKPAGTWLTLVNVGGQNIVITETTNMKSAGNLTLGALDSATFLSNGSDWFQISASNN